jgi:hypothetical protein
MQQISTVYPAIPQGDRRECNSVTYIYIYINMPLCVHVLYMYIVMCLGTGDAVRIVTSFYLRLH